MANYFNYSRALIPDLLLPDSRIFVDAIHARAALELDRALEASRSYYPEFAADDVIPQLCAEAWLPTYDGEPVASARARLLRRSELLDGVGSLAGVARIVSAYLPGRAIVFTRAGRWAQRAADGTETTGELPGPFDYDSANFGGLSGVPLERGTDAFIAVDGHGLTFSTAKVGRPGVKIRRPGETVGLVTSEASRFRALRAALRAHQSALLTIPALVLLSPASPVATYWNPAVPASLPAGTWGNPLTRPRIHRYAGSIK